MTGKVGHSDLVLVRDDVSLVDLRMQDYKPLHAAAVTICATLIDPNWIFKF